MQVGVRASAPVGRVGVAGQASRPLRAGAVSSGRHHLPRAAGPSVALRPSPIPCSQEADNCAGHSTRSEMSPLLVQVYVVCTAQRLIPKEY